MKKVTAVMMAVLIIATANSGLVHAGSAFSDISDSQYEAAIMALYEQGYIQGSGEGQYNPSATLTNAQAIQLLINITGMNIDHIRFIKAPLATDYFKNAQNDAWYAYAFIIAAVNELALDSQLMPNEPMSKEAFIELLVSSMESVYELPMIKMMEQAITDEEEINILYQGGIQRALSYGLLTLDEKGNFAPKSQVTRGEAAYYSNNMIGYAKGDSKGNTSSQLSTDLKGALSVSEDTTGLEPGLRLSFTIENTTDMDIALRYSSSQKMNFIVYDDANKVVYDLSSVALYMQVITDVTIEAKDKVVYEATWNRANASGEQLEPGTYKIEVISEFSIDGQEQALTDSYELVIK